MDNRPIHISDDDLVRYRGRNMAPAELLAADSHFALCDICHGRLIEWSGLIESTRGAAAAFEKAAAGEITHLTYEQLVAFVDNQIDDIDRETLTSHLEMCSPCETELNDLREVHAAINQRPQEQEQKIVRATRSSIFAGLLTLDRWPAFSFLALTALAAVALLSFLISIPLRRENAVVRERVAELEQSNADLREQAGAVANLQNELAELRNENERIRQATQSQTLVALNDGAGRVTLDAQGNLSGLQTTPRNEQVVKEALRTERVKLPPGLGELRSEAGTLMGGPQAGFNVRGPVGVVIETDRPTFRWNALDGSVSYTVTIFDSNLSKVAESDPLTSMEWALPNPLARGRTYIWQVRATKDGQQVVAPPPASGRAKFKVLEQARADEIALAKRSEPRSHLVMGIVYADAGLLNDAEQEFNALLKANPDSPVARKLLQSVRQARR